MTQKDIAKLVGVSSATVSRAINNDPRISKETREHVMKTIAEQGYILNTTARNLRKDNTHTIGFLVPDLNNPYFVNILTESQEFFAQRGYDLLFACSNEHRSHELHAMESFLRYPTSGIIATFVDCENECVAIARKRGIPLILVDRDSQKNKRQHFDCIKTDNFGGMNLAVDHLVGLGHRDIAIVSGPLDLTPGYERYQGFIDRMAYHGLPVHPEYVFSGPFTEESGYHAVQLFLSMANCPTAIITTSSMTTIGAYRSLKDSSVPIPSAISLIGFDDFLLASSLEPPITVVARSVKEMGILIGNQLLSRIESGYSKEDSARSILLPMKLKARSSCMPPNGN